MVSSRRGYDQLAGWYRTIEQLRFGKTLQHSRTLLLDHLQHPRQALFLGDGDGRLLAEFVVRFPGCEVTSVDFSRKMIDLQKRRLGNHEKICWLQEDASQVAFDADSFDLIVTPYFFDCFRWDELRPVVQNLNKWLRDGGILYVVDFRIPQAGFPRYWAKFWIGVMHLFFRWQTGLENRKLIDPRPLLIENGFKHVHEKRLHFEMIYAAFYRKTD